MKNLKSYPKPVRVIHIVRQLAPASAGAIGDTLLLWRQIPEIIASPSAKTGPVSSAFSTRTGFELLKNRSPSGSEISEERPSWMWDPVQGFSRWRRGTWGLLLCRSISISRRCGARKNSGAGITPAVRVGTSCKVQSSISPFLRALGSSTSSTRGVFYTIPGICGRRSRTWPAWDAPVASCSSRSTTIREQPVDCGPV